MIIIEEIVTAPTATNLCTLADFKTMMQITDTDNDAFITDLIKKASGYIETYCNRKFAQQRVKERVKAESDFTVLKLAYAPVTTIHEVKFKGTTVSASLYTTYRKSIGFVDSADGYPWEYTGRDFSYVVEYTFGYKLPGENDRNLPQEIEQACMSMVKAAYLSRDRHPGVKIEDVPQVYKIAFAGGDLPNTSFNVLFTNDVKMLLQPYRVYKL